MAGEVSVIDVETGESQPLGGGRVRSWNVAISEKYAAWIEDATDSDEVFLMERETGEVVQVTQVPAERRNLKIDGNRLIWEDRRNESDEHYTHFDIYAYDIELGQEIPVAVAPGAQTSPAIHGDKAVWLDARNSPTLGDYLNDCQRCPENTFDLYLYDFSTGKERVIIHNVHERAYPDIHGNRIVRADEDADGNPAIILHDLETGLDETLASTPRIGIYPPSVSDRHAVWTVTRACDVVIIPTPDTNTGVFAYNLETRSVAQLTNYVEPQAMLHDGNIVIIHEGCHMAGRDLRRLSERVTFRFALTHSPPSPPDPTAKSKPTATPSTASAPNPESTDRAKPSPPQAFPDLELSVSQLVGAPPE